MITVEEVDALLNQRVEPVEAIEMDSRMAVGRALLQSVRSTRPAPPFNRVMMDGYAIDWDTWKEGRKTFRVAGYLPAGAEPFPLATREKAIEVSTGAVLPLGSDCVVPVEWCDVGEKELRIKEGELDRWQYVHREGADYPAGTVVLEKSSRLHAAHLALATSEGFNRLVVNRTIRIRLITTGDEVVSAGVGKALPWQIFGTHAATLEASLASFRDVVFSSIHLPDNEAMLGEEIVRATEESDLVIICGAMSKGRKDYGLRSIEGSGFEILFHRVGQRPGHPMAVAQKGKVLLFGLPGNPLAALFTFYRHVLPTLDRLRGIKPEKTSLVPVAGDHPTQTDSTRYLACSLRAGMAIPSQHGNSGDLGCLARTDGFLEIPPASNLIRPGQPFAFRPWRP